MAIILTNAIASDKAIALTFNVNVGLSTIGKMVGSYVITTPTVGAVTPTVTSITAAGTIVTIHTTEQTTGATYHIDVSPGSIYAA
jgi:hypothetical protein